MSLDDRIRLFVAIDVPTEWRESAKLVQERLERAAPGVVRWVDPSTLHLTLVFLGYQDRSRLDEVQQAVAAAAEQVAPFVLHWGHPGYFGTRSRPRVVWISTDDPTSRLRRLHTALVDALRRCQVRFDARELVPHLTLGRVKEGIGRDSARALLTGLERLRLERTPSPFWVEEIVLMRSHLRPSGSVYEVLMTFPLSTHASGSPARGRS